MLQTENDSKCKLCQQFGETIDHTIYASPILAKEHDSVCSTAVQHMQGNNGYNEATNTGTCISMH